MNRILVDSGFYFALFDPRDQHHTDACERQGWLEIASVVIPWPILYETVNTRFTRRPDTIARFERIVRAPQTEWKYCKQIDQRVRASSQSGVASMPKPGASLGVR